MNVEDSITAYTRQRYTSQHSREDNLLSSLVATHAGIIGGGSLYSAPSDESLNAKEEVDVSYFMGRREKGERNGRERGGGKLRQKRRPK